MFNYTGEQPEFEGDKSTLIYDSNAKQFKMKWWSTYTNHLHFPKNDWCIEKYESDTYTEMSKIFFDALTGKAEVDAANPLTGTWRFIGYVDELRDAIESHRQSVRFEKAVMMSRKPRRGEKNTGRGEAPACCVNGVRKR